MPYHILTGYHSTHHSEPTAIYVQYTTTTRW